MTVKGEVTWWEEEDDKSVSLGFPRPMLLGLKAH